MRKKNWSIVLFLAILVGFLSCGEDSVGDEMQSKSANVKLKLVDKPGDYLEVNVEIIDVLYNSDEGWKSFESFEGPQNVDLTKLISGNRLLLADEEMPAGEIKEIRLVLGENNHLTIETETGIESGIPLKTPSAQQSGLKLKLNTTLEPGTSYSFILDWDVQKSVVKAGNSGQYILKPVIRVVAEVNSGSLTGVVTGNLPDDDVNGAVPLNNVEVHIYDLDGNWVTSTYTNEAGVFLIEGLPSGNYTFEIIESGFEDYEGEVEIVLGQVNDIGTIELTINNSGD